MGQKIDPWSLVRRPLCRLAEFTFACELVVPGFHEAFFGADLVFYLLVFFAGSTLFDLGEIATRPDLTPPCKDDEPELPLGGDK